MTFPEGEGKVSRRSNEIEQHHRSFLWSLVFTVPVFLTSMVFMYISHLKDGLEIKVVNMLSVGEILRCVLVQFIIGRRFYTGLYKYQKVKSRSVECIQAG